MDEFTFHYDFSRLSAVELQKHKITQRELISVFENHYTRVYPIDGFPASDYYFSIIGFSGKSRFLFVTLNYKGDKVVFHQVIVANEEQIRKFYCPKPKNR